ncbi:MAG: hypothetical protein QOH92_3395 [Chloroflexota bacterium]|jgi:hypothetical protein|nr:hypothetical protein [Chloroflexota bacterium]
MFRLTSKVKIAAGLAAGALTLGGAGAYAAANANNTITVTPTPITVGSGTNQLKLIGFNGTTSLTPPTFTNAGQCVSWLAQNKTIALAPQGTSTGSVKLSKNYHGKLMSGANAWCKTQLTSTAKTDSAQTATPDATDAADAADTTTPPSHGRGHANGHSKHAN